MTRSELMNSVAREADTKKQKIDVSITYRVCKILLNKLSKMTVKEIAKVL